MTIKLLNRLFGRRKEIPKEPSKETPKEPLKPKTLYQAITNYGRIVESIGVLTDYRKIEASTEKYMDKGYVCVDFSVTPLNSEWSYSYNFRKSDYSFKIIYGLEGIVDNYNTVDFLGMCSENIQRYRRDGNYARLDEGTLYYGLEARTRIVIPESSLDNLDDEYLKKLESANGVAETSYYDSQLAYEGYNPHCRYPNFKFGISLRYLSSHSSKIPKIAKRDARVSDAKIQELKRRPIKNKSELIETYSKHPFMNAEKKQRLIEMLRKIPNKIDIVRRLEYCPYQFSRSEEIPLVQNVNSELEELKKQLNVKKERFESQYGKLKNSSDKTTFNMYNPRLKAYLEEDNEKIKNIAYKRMKILDRLCNPEEVSKIRKKVESNGIRSLDKDEWKRYFSTLRALKRIDLNKTEDQTEVSSA